MNPTALVAEDEPLLADQLIEGLAKLWPELEIVGRARDGIEALRLLAVHRPTVLFLDIQMPGVTGLEVARQVMGRAHVVFVTAYDQHAVAAFEQGAVDYVLKPVGLARLGSAVQRLRERILQPPRDLSGVVAGLAQRTDDTHRYLRWITGKGPAGDRFITVDEVCYFRADGDGTVAVAPAFESVTVRSLAALACELDPHQFVPVNASTLVNIEAVAGVARSDEGGLQVRLKRRTEALQVSDACRRALEASLDPGAAGDAVRRTGRLLSTVLFTDIVDSTPMAVRLGDRAWRELLDDHERISRREVERHGGRLIKSTGDGILATFDGPARAIHAALAIGVSLKALGIELRAGVHTGECELGADDVRGIAVHVGARIAQLAGAGEIFVSATVRDLVAGSGIAFVDRGHHSLKGVPGDVRILSVASSPSGVDAARAPQ